jgi:hypothetical protein
MSVTFTAAAQRDRQESTRRSAEPSTHQLLLAATSIVAMLAIGLAYAGRVRVSAVPAGVTVTNLNAVIDARALEPALATAFPAAADRRFVSTQLAAYLASIRQRGGSVPNVGALMGATVTPDAIQRSASTEYQSRLQRAIERAESRGAARPVRIALLTADDLSVIKPALIVRTREAFRRMTVRWSAFYFAAIWTVALMWFLARGDFALLGAAHLLTAVGFAVVLSRSDALRDTALFVRYVQGVLVGCAGLAAVSLIDFRKTALAAFTYIPLAGALFLSVLLVLFGSGPGGSNARVNLGPIQPVEAADSGTGSCRGGCTSPVLTTSSRSRWGSPLPCCSSSCRRISARRSSCPASSWPRMRSHAIASGSPSAGWRYSWRVSTWDTP